MSKDNLYYIYIAIGNLLTIVIRYTELYFDSKKLHNILHNNVILVWNIHIKLQALKIYISQYRRTVELQYE